MQWILLHFVGAFSYLAALSITIPYLKGKNQYVKHSNYCLLRRLWVQFFYICLPGKEFQESVTHLTNFKVFAHFVWTFFALLVLSVRAFINIAGVNPYKEFSFASQV